MKRSRLNRNKPLARARVKRIVPRWKVEDLPRRLFREAASRQRTFHQPGCRARGRWQAHHIVYEQHAKRVGNPHDERNALKIGGCCHYAHHQAVLRIPTEALPDAAIDYAFELFGAAAFDYFGRHYAGSRDDARIVGRLDELTEMGQ